MTAEIEAMELNKTWNLVTLPYGKQLSGYTGFVNEYIADDTIEWYRVRLVVKGYNQQADVV